MRPRTRRPTPGSRWSRSVTSTRSSSDFYILAASMLYSVSVSKIVARRTKALVKVIDEKDALEDHARRDRERLSQLERAGIVSELSSMIAHELRQPVASLINYADGLSLYLGGKGHDPVIDEATREIGRRAGGPRASSSACAAVPGRGGPAARDRLLRRREVGVLHLPFGRRKLVRPGLGRPRRCGSRRGGSTRTRALRRQHLEERAPRCSRAVWSTPRSGCASRLTSASKTTRAGCSRSRTTACRSTTRSSPSSRIPSRARSSRASVSDSRSAASSPNATGGASLSDAPSPGASSSRFRFRRVATAEAA